MAKGANPGKSRHSLSEKFGRPTSACNTPVRSRQPDVSKRAFINLDGIQGLRSDCFALLTSNPTKPLVIRRKKSIMLTVVRTQSSLWRHGCLALLIQAFPPHRMATRCVALAAGRFGHNGLRPRSA